MLLVQVLWSSARKLVFASATQVSTMRVPQWPGSIIVSHGRPVIFRGRLTTEGPDVVDDTARTRSSVRVIPADQYDLNLFSTYCSKMWSVTRLKKLSFRARHVIIMKPLKIVEVLRYIGSWQPVNAHKMKTLNSILTLSLSPSTGSKVHRSFMLQCSAMSR